MTSGERLGDEAWWWRWRRRDQWPQHGSFHSHRAPPLWPFQVLMHPGEWGKLKEIEIAGETEEVNVYEGCMMVHTSRRQQGVKGDTMSFYEFI